METDGKGVAEQPSQELWHSLDFDKSVVVDIEVGPGLWELGLEVFSGLLVVVLEVGVDNLVGDGFSTCLVQEHVTGRLSFVSLLFESVVLDQRVHESIVSLFGVLLWDFSLVSSSELFIETEGLVELW